MALDQKQKTTRSSGRTGVISVLVWLTASLVGTIAISVAAGHAPERIRLIGLFPIVFGSAIGWIAARLARELSVQPSRRLLAIAAFLMAIAGWITVTGETFRLEEMHAVKLPSDGLAAQVMKEFERQVKGTELEIPRPNVLSSFRSFLSRRIQNIGDWPSPWPECFLIAESIATAFAAVVMSSLVEQTNGDRSDNSI